MLLYIGGLSSCVAGESADETALREARLVVERAVYVPLEKRMLRLLAEREEIDAYYASALAEELEPEKPEVEQGGGDDGAVETLEEGAKAMRETVAVAVAVAERPLPKQKQHTAQRHAQHVGWSPMREVLVRRANEMLCDEDQAYFGIPPSHSSPSGWADATAALRKIDDPRNRLPSEKLACLLRAAREINAAVIRAERERAGADRDRRRSIGAGADVFLPIHVWVVVHARLRAPLLTSAVLTSLCSSDALAGEAGYYLVAFQSALAFIEDEGARVTRNS